MDSRCARIQKFYKVVFMIVAWADLILGVALALFYRSLYSLLDIPLPANPGYVHIAAAFVFVQGVGFYFAYRDMERNIDIVKMGLVAKGSYAGIAFYYWPMAKLPHPIFVIFGVLDAILVVLFGLYLIEAGRAKRVKRSSAIDNEPVNG